jgi:hypothetical protein
MESKEEKSNFVLNSVLNSVSFGIELETCFSILGRKFSDGIVARKQLYECMKNKSDKYCSWEYLRYSKLSKYTTWIISEDSSIVCPGGEKTLDADDDFKEVARDQFSCILRGSKTSPKNCENITFHPVEIVSPKLTGNKGLELLAYTFYAFLYTDNVVYSVNDSQGLHINISYPNMDTEKFIKLWTIFEPVILNCVPEHRRNNEYCKALSEMDNPYYNSCSDKYVSVRTHGEGGLRRLEVRLQQGSMDFFEIYFWLLFCIYILILSKTLQTIPEKIDIYTLLLLLEDDGLQRMIIERYNRYKDKSLKSVTFRPSNKNLFIHPWNKWDDETQKVILEKRYTICKRDYNKIITDIEKLTGKKIKELLEQGDHEYTEKELVAMYKKINMEKDILLEDIQEYIPKYLYNNQTIPQLKNELAEIKKNSRFFRDILNITNEIETDSVDKYLEEYQKLRKKYETMISVVGEEFKGERMEDLEKIYDETLRVSEKLNIQNKTYKELQDILKKNINSILGFNLIKRKSKEIELKYLLEFYLSFSILKKELLGLSANTDPDSSIKQICKADKTLSKNCKKFRVELKYDLKHRYAWDLFETIDNYRRSLMT